MAFTRCLSLMVRGRVKVTLLHYFHIPPFASLFGDESFRRKLERESVAKRRELDAESKKFIKVAREQGVVVEFTRIDDRGIFDPCGAILRWSRRHKADLIGLAAQSSPVRTRIFGALSRELARESSIPVLIYRTPSPR